jgi:hypothetical protein
MEGTDRTIIQTLESSDYRMKNAHFKLGSKIHITDFIYARKMYQQNYFVDIFADEVVNYIKENIQNGDYTLQESEDHKTRITLIGYASYSQMLLNKIVLKIQIDNDIQIDNENINYDLLSDVDTARFLKKETIYENILIIVPITTTFSTGIKIEQAILHKALNDQKPKNIEYDDYIKTFNFLEPYVNLILISPGNLEEPNYVVKLNEYLNTDDESDEKNREYPCKLFKWKNVDTTKKEITIETDTSLRESKAGDKKKRKEKYFYSIKSEWYVPDSCPHCFPDKEKLIEEKLLLETDKTSVTPKLQLDLPRSYTSHKQRNDKKTKNNVYIKEDSHKCSHYEHLNEHFLHYINAKTFFDTYPKEVNSWTKAYKEVIRWYCSSNFEEVLLISPSRGNNIFFVDFINRTLFENKAKIISYEVEEDYIENYQKFFKNYIKDSTIIFYVDTFLKSGGTFRLVNNFLKYCKLEFGESSRNPCDGLFFLISKANNYVRNNVSSLLKTEKNFFCFHELYIQNIEKKTCPLCLEQERYKKLAEDSILDTVRHYFLNKVNRLRTREVGSIKEEEEKDRGLTDWKKYHPLVKDSELIVFPWENDASPETKQLYETFIEEDPSHSLPGRKYLKILIEHKLNYLLSNDEDIIRRIGKDEDILTLANKKNIQFNKDLLSDIIEKIKKEVPFNGWIKYWANTNKPTLRIFNNIFEEVVLKVFTLQPFINSMPVKKRVFAWILIQLDEHIKDLVNPSKQIDFDTFRKLKFLMRRATLLNSNYIIRQKTLENLRIIIGRIYKDDDSFFRIEQKNYQTAKDFLEQKDIDKQQKDYVEQIKKNIEYKDRSYNEFNYFYVSLIKELLIENPSKVTKIESNINKFLCIEDIKKEKTFYNLLKLIQYENTTEIKQGLTIVAEDYLNRHDIVSFNNKFRTPQVRQELTNGFKEAMNDSRLSTLKKFIALNQENSRFKFDEWSETEDFYHYLHLLYLLAVLLNEENSNKFENTTKLEDKMETILQNLFRIACDPKKHDIGIDSIIKYRDDPNSGAFIVLKFRNEHEDYAKPEDLFMAYSTKNIDESFSNIEVDFEALSYFMINGLCNKSIIEANRGFYKPNTILQFNKIENGKKWEPLIGHLSPRVNAIHNISSEFSKIYDSQTGFGSAIFTEDIYIPNSDISKYCFLRISDLKIDKNKNTVVNKGSGVVTFFSKEEFDIKRLRLLMVVKDHIQKFIAKHYETDSITAFINERIELKEYKKLSHGFEDSLSVLSALAISTENIENRKVLGTVLFNVIRTTGPILKSMLNALNQIKKADNILVVKDTPAFSKLAIQRESIKDISCRIKELITIVVESTLGGISLKKETCTFDISRVDNPTPIIYSWSIYQAIIAEIVINAKKYKPHGEDIKLKFYIEEDLRQQDLFWLKFTNEYRANSMTEKKRATIKSNNIRFSIKGLSLIKRLSFSSTGISANIDCTLNSEINEFYTNVPLKSLK